MVRVFRWLGLAVGSALLIPAWAQEKPAQSGTKPPVKERLLYVGTAQGRITRVDTNNRLVWLDIPGRGSVELQATDDAKIRLATPPPAFDDKGNIKVYTKAELDKLKGPDKRLPGYPGDFDNVRPGAVVSVYVYRRPGGTAIKPPAGGDKNALAPERLLFTMLVVQQPGNGD
ncbi:MAG: hypothetical protein NZ700_08140 [Gemmataceae bacterium]|nr:hypothetical protein [Gemmataceae bacterium]MDW8264375.1 hypothetical protein [Gemmataceae bacterium]